MILNSNTIINLMNLNNHIKETPSVKLHNAPGGKQTLNLFGGDE